MLSRGWNKCENLWVVKQIVEWKPVNETLQEWVWLEWVWLGSITSFLVEASGTILLCKWQIQVLVKLHSFSAAAATLRRFQNEYLILDARQSAWKLKNNREW